MAGDDGTLVIKGGKAYIERQLMDVDILIGGGKILEIGRGLSADEDISAEGKLVLSGAIDVHVHCRDLEEAYKEDWCTASCAAAAGGVTTIVDQPNTRPQTDNVEAFEVKLHAAEKSSIVDYGINAAPNKDVNAARALWSGGACEFGEIFMSEQSIHDVYSNLELVSNIGSIACLHAEDMLCTKKHAARPPECELTAIENAVKFADSTPDARLHICHLSAANGLETINQSANGNITVEATPHHLLLTKKDFEEQGAYAKMNPPLRSDADRRGLWEGVNDGRIDIIASDHAPHTRDEKEQNVMEAPSGVPGVETMLPLMLGAVKQNIMSLDTCMRLLSENPALIFGFGSKGQIKVGFDADLVIVDMKKDWTVRSDELSSKCGWTPFEGWSAVRPWMTVLRGAPVYANDSITVKPGYGKFLKGLGCQ